jgi:hypothetical protein
MNTLLLFVVGRGSVDSAVRTVLFLRHHHCSRYCTPPGSSWAFVTSMCACELLALGSAAAREESVGHTDVGNEGPAHGGNARPHDAVGPSIRPQQDRGRRCQCCALSVSVGNERVHLCDACVGVE